MKKTPVLVVLSFLLLCLMGCQKERNSTTQIYTSKQQPIAETVSPVQLHVSAGRYTLSFRDESEIDGVQAVTVLDDLCVFTGATFEPDTGRAQYFMEEHCVDTWLGCEPLPVSEDGYLSATYCDLNHRYYIVEQLDAQRDEIANWVLYVDAKPLEILNAAPYTDRTTAVWADETKILIATEKRILCISRNGELLWQQDVCAEQFFKYNNGIAYLDGSNCFFNIDLVNGKLTVICKLPALFTDVYQVFDGKNSGYDCLVIANEALYGWNIDSNDISQILSFDSVGLNSMRIGVLACLDDNTFIGTTWRPQENTDRVFLISPAETDNTDIKTIRIAGNTRPMIISAAIADFRLLHPEYEVEYIDVSEKYPDETDLKLTLDLLYDECPDLLILNGLPYEIFSRRGLLENLYSFIDQDTELTREQLMPALLQALESEDSKLYQLPQTWSIVTAVGLKSTVDSFENWSINDMIDLIEAYPSIESAFYREQAENLARLLLMHAPYSFVDYNTHVSNFDSPEFLAFLHFLKRTKETDISYTFDNAQDAMVNGEVLLNEVMILNVEGFSQLYEASPQKLSFIGYPNANGNSFYLNLPMAIPTRSNEKEGAWEFMKMLFSSNYYSTRGGFLPLQKDFDMAIANLKSEPSHKESAEALEQILEDTNIVCYYDAAVTQILMDELPYYLEGDQSDTQTANMIQSRVQLYLDETYS